MNFKRYSVAVVGMILGMNLLGYPGDPIKRIPKKLVNPCMAQLNGMLKVLNLSNGAITGGRVAASMEAAANRAKHVLELLEKSGLEPAQKALTSDEVRHVGFILLPVKAFFTQIRMAGDMIVPLIKESLGEKGVGVSYLINYFGSKDDCDIQTYLEKIITTRGLLYLFCTEMSAFCGDIQASFSEDVLKLQEEFKKQHAKK